MTDPEVTDAMVEAACEAHFLAKQLDERPGITPHTWEWASTVGYGRVWADARRKWMRAAIKAALSQAQRQVTDEPLYRKMVCVKCGGGKKFDPIRCSSCQGHQYVYEAVSQGAQDHA